VLKTTPTSTTAYIGKIYEQSTINGITKDVSHIYAGSKLVESIEQVAGLQPTIKYMHGDHLGSISVITDAGGAVIERLRFDVFGAPVNPTTGAATGFATSNTTRGYTGHEMDASTGLINMNARLYDPVLGRFISADTVIPEPGNMQSFNRYSYVLNNPLLYIDPTGHSWWTSFRDSFLVPVAQQVTTWVVAAVLITAGVDPMTAYGIGGFTSSLIFGGNGRENITSGIMAAATYKIGHSGLKPGTRYLLHGALTAANFGVNGGNPAQGFLLGLTSATFNGAIVGVKTGNGFTDFAIHVTLSAMVGGTTNAAMGGSFADGASNATRIMLMNEVGEFVRDALTWEVARDHYRGKSGGTITIDAGGLYVLRTSPYNAKNKATGIVVGPWDAWAVHGNVTLHLRVDGTVGIYNAPYDFNLIGGFRHIIRDTETYWGGKINGSGVPYTIQYKGNAHVWP